MKTNGARHSDRKGSGGILRRLALGAAAGLVLSGASVLWTTPAAAGHDGDSIYCEVHRGRFEPGHYRRHAVGYVLTGPAGYRFYTAPSYARLSRAYSGRPALYVSGGYFYPRWIGYGTTHLGFQIGLPAFPTVGVRFLGYPPRVAHHSWHHRHHRHPGRH